MRRRAKRGWRSGERVNPALLQYPRRQSEFEVQAYLFSEMKAMGLDVRGEVRAGRESRFDLVVFEDKKPTTIVEVKRRISPKNPTSFRQREKSRRQAEQMERYKKYEVEAVVLIEGMKQAEEFIWKLRGEG